MTHCCHCYSVCHNASMKLIEAIRIFNDIASSRRGSSCLRRRNNAERYEPSRLEGLVNIEIRKGRLPYRRRVEHAGGGSPRCLDINRSEEMPWRQHWRGHVHRNGGGSVMALRHRQVRPRPLSPVRPRVIRPSFQTRSSASAALNRRTKHMSPASR